jgi:hypothetical protein
VNLDTFLKKVALELSKAYVPGVAIEKPKGSGRKSYNRSKEKSGQYH